MAFAVVHIHAPEGFAAGLAAGLPGRRCVVWPDVEAVRAGIGEAEFVVAGSLPAGLRAERLRWVHALGAGVDGLVDAVPASVPIVRIAALTAGEVCEHAWALVLALARQVPVAVEQQRARVWRRFTPRGLAGRTLVVLGLGAIGARVAAVGAALGMRVLGTRRRARALPGIDEVHGPEATAELLGRADVVVVALPRTAATSGLLGEELLARLRPGALLVAVSRGGIVDEAALVRRLREGTLAGAALDVTAEEPLPASSPLWGAPNLLLTPHVGGWTPDYAARVAGVIRANLDRLERGLTPMVLVDRAHGY